MDWVICSRTPVSILGAFGDEASRAPHYVGPGHAMAAHWTTGSADRDQVFGRLALLERHVPRRVLV
jgi:hypothetical protein